MRRAAAPPYAPPNLPGIQGGLNAKTRYDEPYRVAGSAACGLRHSRAGRRRSANSSPRDIGAGGSGCHGTTLSDLINGLGGAAQFVAFAEVYTALERGIFDAGMTGGSAGHDQRWYEVADYIVGPAISMPADLLIFNPYTWASLPGDFQQILIEEGARAELEELRMAPVWNATGLQKKIDEGMLPVNCLS